MTAASPEGNNTSPKATSRDRILDAARTLFAERSFSSCRVADIARSAGMSAGNVYWLFDSKEAILKAILAEGFANVEAMTAEVADGVWTRPPEARPPRGPDPGPLRREQRRSWSSSPASWVRVAAELISSLGLDMPEIAGRSHANLRRVFAEARSEGAVAPADPDQLVVFYLGFFNGLVTTYGDLWPGLPRETVREAALRLVGYRPAG